MSRNGMWVRCRFATVAASCAAAVLAPASAFATTYTVTSATDGAPGSIRALLGQAIGGDTIVVPDPTSLTPSASRYTLTDGSLASGAGSSAAPVTISGAGANLVTIDAGKTSRVLTVTAGDVQVDGVTLTNGSGTYSTTPGSLLDGYGGAVLVEPDAILELVHSAITNSTATYNNAGFTGGGGGLGTFATSTHPADVELRDDLVAGDTATTSTANSTAAGGGLYLAQYTTAVVSDSTFTGNTASATGAGAFAYGGGIDGATSLTHDTLAANTASSVGAGDSGGGNLYAIVGGGRMVETIVTGGNAVAGPDCYGSSPYTEASVGNADLGHNLVSMPDGTVCTAAGNGDLTGPAGIDTALGNNGGPTQTLRLLSGSPAIGAGHDCTFPDQRGLQGSQCDIGAYFPASPGISTTFATIQTTATTAHLGGIGVAADGPQGTVHVSYGTSAGGENVSTADQTVPAGADAGITTAFDLTNLSPSTTYYFVVTASTPDGTTSSTESSFRTAPAVATGAATNVTTDAATLNGTVTPNGDDLNCTFDFGTDAGYGQTMPCLTSIGTTGGPVAVTGAARFLTPGTTYHYRIEAHDIEARTTVYGADATFTTLGGTGSGGTGSGGGSQATAAQAAVDALTRERCGHATVRRFLRAGGCLLSFASPGPGTLTVVLKSGRHVLARATRSITGAGNVAVVLRLTRSGRMRVTHARHGITLVLQARFADSTGHTYTSTGRPYKLRR